MVIEFVVALSGVKLSEVKWEMNLMDYISMEPFFAEKKLKKFYLFFAAFSGQSESCKK